MRLWVWVFVCLIMSLLAGCSTFGKQNELSQSLATWNQLKTENGDHYRYTVSPVSGIITPSTTTLTVQNGRVITRSYNGPDNTSPEEVLVQWTEQGNEIGSHDYGADPVTIDQRYETCQNDVLTQNPIDNEILLRFMDNGVLAYCAAFSKDLYYGGGFDGGGENLGGLEFLN